MYVTGYAGTRDYVGNMQSPWRTQHRSTHPTEKQDSNPLVTRSVHRTPAQKSQRKGRSLQREGRSLVFQWDVWIGEGSSTETAVSLRNPESRRTPSYINLSYAIRSDERWPFSFQYVFVSWYPEGQYCADRTERTGPAGTSTPLSPVHLIDYHRWVRRGRVSSWEGEGRTGVIYLFIYELYSYVAKNGDF